MRNVILLLCGILVAGSVASAHHSYGATYDVKKEIKLEGKLAQFVYRNPHAFVHMTAPDEHGTMQRWAVEWSGTSQLANDGVTRESLKVGDAIIVTGRPSRPGSCIPSAKPDSSNIRPARRPAAGCSGWRAAAVRWRSASACCRRSRSLSRRCKISAFVNGISTATPCTRISSTGRSVGSLRRTVGGTSGGFQPWRETS